MYPNLFFYFKLFFINHFVINCYRKLFSRVIFASAAWEDVVCGGSERDRRRADTDGGELGAAAANASSEELGREHTRTFGAFSCPKLPASGTFHTGQTYLPETKSVIRLCINLKQFSLQQPRVCTKSN